MAEPEFYFAHCEELEKIEFIGDSGRATISLAYCDENFWAFSVSLDFHDTLDSYHGFGSLFRKGASGRAETIEMACGVIRGRVAKERNNPKAVSDITAWLNNLLSSIKQLSLFDSAASNEGRWK